MAKFATRNTGDTSGYVLWDTPDELLRALSAAYIASCFEKLSAHLTLLGIDPSDLRFGWLHPGAAVLPPGRESPWSYVGWLWPEGRSPRDEKREAEGAAALSAVSPRLHWGASYRSGVFDCRPERSTEIMQAMREYVIEDPSAGHPEWLARGAADSNLITNIVDACARRDRLNVTRALERTIGTYSDDGAQLLRIAVMQWLDGPDGAPEADP